MSDTNTKPAKQPEISERSQLLLKGLIERFIREGQPIGSRVLSKSYDLSPATIRNVMADLEDMGFLESPHTSAGRVPTVRGYRFFVDSLMQVKQLQGKEVAQWRSQLAPTGTSSELVQSASSLLSSITHLAGLVTVPRAKTVCLRQVEFLPLSGTQVLAIMVINEREVQNRVITTRRKFDEAELKTAANYMNAMFAGRSLREVRSAMIAEIKNARETMNATMEDLVSMAEQTFGPEETGDDFIVAGETNLMGAGELSDVEKLRHLFEAFSEKGDMLHLFDQCMHADGMQVFIGEESGFDVLGDCSVVTAPYSVGGEVVGVLGVIGPTRMAYERVIPIVDVTAKLLASALGTRNI